MASVEGGVITFFSEDEIERAKSACPGCPLNLICGTPDSKSGSAEMHPTIADDPTDEEILASAACLKT